MSDIGCNSDIYSLANSDYCNGDSRYELSINKIKRASDSLKVIFEETRDGYVPVIVLERDGKEISRHGDVDLEKSSWSYKGDALKSFFNVSAENMSVVYVLGSYHYDEKYIYYTDGSSRRFNSFNPGVGLEVPLSDNSYYTFGAYINSYYRLALGGAYGIETKGGPLNGFFGVGVEIGGLLGYRDVRWDELISYVIPYGAATLRVGYPDKINMKFTLIPPIRSKDINVAGSVGAMLRKPF